MIETLGTVVVEPGLEDAKGEPFVLIGELVDTGNDAVLFEYFEVFDTMVECEEFIATERDCVPNGKLSFTICSKDSQAVTEAMAGVRN